MPTNARGREKTAGSRAATLDQRSEFDRMWKPLLKAPLTNNHTAERWGRTQQRLRSLPARTKHPRISRQGDAKGMETFLGTAARDRGEAGMAQLHPAAPMVQAQGTRRLMSPAACVNFHPFVETLREWEEGVPVDCGEDWDMEKLEAALAQGPHKSALSKESIELVEEDVAYQVKAGYAEVVEWEELRRTRPPKLKISPLAVIPQANRRGRMILDLSFPVIRQTQGKGRKRRQDQEILQKSVNDSTVRMAPEAPVKELGNVLGRLFHFMAEVPEEEEIVFSKIDLADGYWRMIVEKDSRYNFAYVMPSANPEAPLRLVIPSALQMGWNESPAYFCAATETARDIAQAWIGKGKELSPHPLESWVKPEIEPRRQTTGAKGVCYQMGAVYVDDFVQAVVQDRQGELLETVARASLHAIHSIFPPPSASGHPGAKDPISEKKLAKGDARWSPTKEILGYELDGRRRTVKLPQAKSEALLKETRKILKNKKRVPLKSFRSLAGRLQHAARILPAAKSFFTPMNEALRGLPAFIGIARNGEVRKALLDAVVLIADLARRPTHVRELVRAGEFAYVGFCDASAFGAGGVWFSGSRSLPPTVWRVEFPPDITREVVSDANPNGRLTNSDLEMAGVLLHYLALEQVAGSLRHVQVAIGSDNTPAVAWTTKMATRASSPVAYHLLRGLALRQRYTRAAPPEIFHVAGKTNTLADVASREVKINGIPLPNSAEPNVFLTYFNSKFPLPQSSSWNIVTLDSEMRSNVILTLRGTRLGLQRWTTKSDGSHGHIGPATQRWSPKLTPTLEGLPGKNRSMLCLPLPPGFELESSERVGKLDHSLWRKPCVTWRKPSVWWDTGTLDDQVELKS